MPSGLACGAMLRRAPGPFDGPKSRNEMHAIIEALQAKQTDRVLKPTEPSASIFLDSRVIVNAPIDLSPIHAKLDTYATLRDFAIDVRRIFDAACAGALDPAVRRAVKLLSYLFETKLVYTLDQVRTKACNRRPPNDAKRHKRNPREDTAASCKPMTFFNSDYRPPLHLSVHPSDDADDTETPSYTWHNDSTRLVLPSSPPSSSTTFVLEALWQFTRDEFLSRREHAAQKHQDREKRIFEARLNEAKHREECLAELERSREADAARNIKKRKDELNDKRDKDEKRKRDREVARRNRDKLEQTVDLDMQRFAVSSFLEAAGSPFPDFTRRD